MVNNRNKATATIPAAAAIRSLPVSFMASPTAASAASSAGFPRAATGAQMPTITASGVARRAASRAYSVACHAAVLEAS